VAALAPIATAMIDVSDGLASEIHHLCRHSRVGALVQGDRVPFHPAAGKLAAAHGLDLLEWALSGGDDYELLYTVDPTDRSRVLGGVIGEITAEPGVRLARNGIIEPLADRGYDHCRAGIP
jgi:thiamine-monophosphate kinase